MDNKNNTCKDCRYFIPYNDGNPDGRCPLGWGTYCTHTLGTQEACGQYMERKEQSLNRAPYKEKKAYELQACFENAVEACETLLSKARELYSLAKNEQWQRMLEVLKDAKGYGYFDDDYYRQMIQKHIDQYGEE